MLINVFSLDIGFLLGIFLILFGAVLYIIREDLKSRQVNPECKCRFLVDLGSWTCEVHGPMVAHKDLRNGK